MKCIFISATVLLALSSAVESLPAFPGAQGFGSLTPGGRGGQVIAVTNLDDAGPGSFRDGCRTAGPRIIVFRTGGIVSLKSEIQIVDPFVTIAGQTAPGDGFVIKDNQLIIITHDVIIRGLRIRVGDSPLGGTPEVRDCLGFLGGANNVVIDHCSFSWAIDETMAVWENSHSITIQWCILSEALLNSLHSKIGHSMGYLSGNGSDRTTVHHCLFAHNNGRNPLLFGGTHEFINNVIFDWGYSSEFMEDQMEGVDTIPIKADVAGNYWKPLSNGSRNEKPISINFPYASSESRLYVADNFYMGDTFFTAAERAGLDSLAILLPESSAVDTSSGIVAEGFAHAYDTVLAASGALLPQRDAVDTRIVQDVIDSTGKIVDCVGPDTIFHPTDTARGGTDSTILLAHETTSIEPRGYQGRQIEIFAGTGAGQIRTITFFNPGSLGTDGNPVYIQEAKVDPFWDTAPDSTSVYRMIIPCSNNAGGWPIYSEGTSPVDTDCDGMPDSWETAKGLNPNDPADASGTGLDNQGYTNIEVYINGLFDNYLINVEGPVPTGQAEKQIGVIPNPFNSSTTINIRKTEDGNGKRKNIDLKIYNINGKLIMSKTVFRLHSTVTVKWDAREMASGIYLLKLKIGNQVFRKQLVLIR